MAGKLVKLSQLIHVSWHVVDSGRSIGGKLVRLELLVHACLAIVTLDKSIIGKAWSELHPLQAKPKLCTEERSRGANVVI
jgi:hypothetical protein